MDKFTLFDGSVLSVKAKRNRHTKEPWLALWIDSDRVMWHPAHGQPDVPNTRHVLQRDTYSGLLTPSESEDRALQMLLMRYGNTWSDSGGSGSGSGSGSGGSGSGSGGSGSGSRAVLAVAVVVAVVVVTIVVVEVAVVVVVVVM